MKFIDKKLYRKFDFWLLAIVAAITIYGLIVLTNATASPFNGTETTAEIMEKLDLRTVMMQGLWFVLGLVAMFFVTTIDYESYGEMYKIFLWGSVVILFIVVSLTRGIRGTRGWFSLGERGIQPAELAKIALIIVLAKVTVDSLRDKGHINSLRDVVKITSYVALPVVLIMLQPDWGTAFVYIMILAGILFAAKLSWKIFALIILGGGAAGVGLYYLFSAEWQESRILSFLSPDADISNEGMHVDRSIKVIQSGGLTGKGMFSEGTLSQLGYLPEKQTDFIFPVLVETFGMIGGIVLILLYALLIIRMIYIALTAKDRFGTLLVAGVIAMFTFHIVENIGMCMKLMPVTGIPLPFVSYGGSNMLTNMLGIGLVENVAMRRIPLKKRRLYISPSERMGLPDKL